MERIILWWVQCVVAHAEAPRNDERRHKETEARLEAASDLISEAQDLTARAFQRYGDARSHLAETIALAHRLQGRPEKAPERFAGTGESCSLELVSAPAGPCTACEEEVGLGVVGWRRTGEPGPLCGPCLARSSPELGAVLGAVNYLRRSVRGEGEHEHDGDPEAAARSRLEMARRYARATAGAWPPRPLGILPMLSRAFDRREELEEHWLGKLERGGGAGGQEPS